MQTTVNCHIFTNICIFLENYSPKARKQFIDALQTLVAQCNTQDGDVADKGLSKDQLMRLVELIAKKQIKIKREQQFLAMNNSTALNLPGYLSARFIRCLVPKEKLSGDVVQLLALWLLTNCHRLSIKHCLEPMLRWINSVLQFDICVIRDLRCLYEAFFQIINLTCDRVVSYLLDT